MSEQSIKIGEKVADVELLASNGAVIKLSDFVGKKLVLYFYPRDMTPGCTQESCDFRDFNNQFSRYNVEVIGVSPDDLESHQQFAAQYELPFLLLSDPDQELCRQFGVWQQLSWQGKEFMGVNRSTFIIDEAGTLRKEWLSVKVEGHAEEVLEAIKQL